MRLFWSSPILSVAVALPVFATDLLASEPARQPEPSVWTAPPVDVGRLIEEDSARSGRVDLPIRVGHAMRTSLTPWNSGTWSTLADGVRVWTLDLHSPGALWLVVGLDRFDVENGVALSILDTEDELLAGPFDESNEREHGELWFPPLPGDRLRLALRVPPGVEPDASAVQIGTVSHGYGPWNRAETDAEAAQISCSPDVACPEGEGWHEDARAIVRILHGGTHICSGALVNNTANDCTPYVITAAHCPIDPPSATVNLNYRRPRCRTRGGVENQVLTGSTLVAFSPYTDTVLLRLDRELPPEFDARLVGWSRSEEAPTRATGLHHPGGDFVKVAHNEESLTSRDDDYWTVNRWEVGSVQPGSSGSPLFDANHRLVGQLRGTNLLAPICHDGGSAYYGKFARFWSQGASARVRGRDWLDPVGTDPTTLDGIDASFCRQPQPRLRVASYSLVESRGNGDGTIDPGETIQLSLVVENVGTIAATNVTLRLVSEDPSVFVVPDEMNLGDLPVAVVVEAPPFELRVSPAHNCGEPIALRVLTAAAEAPGLWGSAMTLDTGLPRPEQVVFTDDLETRNSNWSVTVFDECSNGSGCDNHPWERSTRDSANGATSWFAPQGRYWSSTAIELGLPAPLGENAFVTFQHRMKSVLENASGGMLEYSTDGGSWSGAEGLFETGGPTELVRDPIFFEWSYGPAWYGDFPWRTAVVDLSSLAGRDVRLRWRFESYYTFDHMDGGWFVDDVRLVSRPHECAPPPRARAR